jgi:probable F420-dependent oxidoreductase
MRFSIGLPTDEVQHHSEFLTAEGIADMARAAEDAGFWACAVTDHPFPTDRWMKAGGHHAQDPFVALSFAAAHTTRLKLLTNILVLPYRNPFVAARSISTLDFISGGRVVIGAAAGYLKGEYKALGIDFDRRNEISDETLRAMIAAWTNDVVEFEGTGYTALGNVMEPKPASDPYPPLWIGGNSRRAIRRAVELGDGWIPFPSPATLARTSRTAQLETLDDLRERLGYLHEHAEKVGRDRPLDVSFSPLVRTFNRDGSIEAQQTVDHIGQLADLGVTCVMGGVPASNRAEFRDNAQRYAEEIISKVP